MDDSIAVIQEKVPDFSQKQKSDDDKERWREKSVSTEPNFEVLDNLF